MGHTAHAVSRFAALQGTRTARAVARPVALSLPLPEPWPAQTLIAGIDEAGRGCLAGPVVAAAVILPQAFELTGLADSKALSARTREALAPRIKACAVAWGLGVVWNRRIDRINILAATFEAMSLAARSLATPPDVLLIDGNKIVPEATLAPLWRRVRQAPLPRQRAIVRGDASVAAISAASILAKTFRDRLMCALGRRWPGYGFERHKGYGTADHLAALRRLGPCPLHRRSFRGVPGQPATDKDATGTSHHALWVRLA